MMTPGTIGVQRSLIYFLAVGMNHQPVNPEERPGRFALLQRAKWKVYPTMKFSGPADPGFSIPPDLVGFVECF